MSSGLVFGLSLLVCRVFLSAADPGTEDNFTAPEFVNTTKMEKQLIIKPAGAYVKIQCPAAGHPTPSITWLKDGQPIERSVGKKTIYKNWSLGMGQLTVDDTGNYTCQLTNDKGSISWTYRVEVQARITTRPIILDLTPHNATVVEGDSVELRCSVLTDLTPFVQWLKHFEVNGSYFDRNNLPYTRVLQGSTPEILDPFVYKIPRVTVRDAGWYTCVVASIAGKSYKSTWLRVQLKA